MRHNDPQVNVTGRLIETQGDGEAIAFNVNLVFFQLSIIANIPPEGETEAPVYVRYRLFRGHDQSQGQARGPEAHRNGHNPPSRNDR